ncbi:DNA-binding NarL/FixJ family response regulator [Trueperella bonasi]|uniref:DNA-binding NarL/FixJ family response regulator n=1 Tax=Trueperella bonasi TaxID=312286 RepID=A0ABT9NIH9_9ACTO|nr:response regulator transcription factor [Trueperella bonasi]MDP9807149.1 DNA-binding NarL/FixJ family response regulator [Trueperella bonasi]
MKVIVVDDHDLVRSGIIAQLDGHDGIAVVAEAASVTEASDVISTVLADVVLLDVHLPGGDGGGGAEVIRRTLASSGPKPRFLALSVSDAADDVVSVIRAGARGYVTKSINSEGLIEALHRVNGGDAAFSPKLAGFVLDAFGTSASSVAERDEELDRLSAREQEVMRLIARGYTYKEAASELFISIKTIETHVSACLRKLQLSNRKELSRWAAARGID